jgi:multiple sugar transport system permease protein
MNRTRTQRKTLWGIEDMLVIVWCLIPVMWLASLSFKDPATFGDGSFIPTRWTLENYRGIFSTDLFNRALVNSIGIALIATTLAVVVATSAAYAIARLRFPGKRVLLGATLLVSMFPPISLVSPLFTLWRQLGLFDTWLGLIIPYLTFSLPLAIYTLSAFFREIPWELERAAQVDGATPMQAFLRVIAPLAAPGMVTTAILVFSSAGPTSCSRSHSPRPAGPRPCRPRSPSSPGPRRSRRRSARSPPPASSSPSPSSSSCSSSSAGSSPG